MACKEDAITSMLSLQIAMQQGKEKKEKE